MMRRASGAALLMAGYATLVGAWVAANPPSAAPDESSHYIKAVALSRGDLGRPAPPGGPSRLDEAVRETSRIVSLPARLAPGTIGCLNQNPNSTAECLNAPQPPLSDDPVDVLAAQMTYQPYVYAVPGLAANLGGSRNNALRLGRLAFALQALALVALGLWLLTAGATRPLVLLGPLLAVTPMVVFVSSSLSSSAIEVSAGFALAAGAIRFARPEPLPPRYWAAVAAAGALLAVSRPAGPVWVLLAALIALSLAGRGATRMRLIEHRRAATPAGVLIAAGIVAGVAWQLAVQPGSGATAGSAVHVFYSSLTRLPGWVNEEIGLFGLVDTPMPGFAYTLWTGMLVGLITLGALVADRRGRWTLAWSLGLALLLPVAFDALVAIPQGGNAQGRWSLPFAVAVPLLAGELLTSGAARLPLRRPELLLWPVAVACAMVQFLGFWSNAQRYAVGVSGPDWFFGDARWSPPAGWAPWTVMALTGAVGLVAAAWWTLREAPAPAAD